MDFPMIYAYDHFRTCTLGLVTNHGAAADSVAGSTAVLVQVMKRGSSRYSEQDIARLIDGKGGIFFTAVKKDYVVFGARVLPKYLEMTLNLLFDLLSNPLLEINGFEVEREKLLQNVQQINANSLQKMLFFDADKAVFGSTHPLGRSQIGDEESLSNMRVDDLHTTLTNFNKQPWGFLVGKFDQAILSKVQTKFDAFSPPRPPSGHQTHLPDRQKANKVAVISPVPSDRNVYLCLNITAKATPINVAFCRFSSALLGGSFGSRMFTILRDQLGLGYIVGSNLSILDDTLIVKCFMETNPARVGKALDRLTDLVLDLGRTPVLQREFDITRDFLINGLDLDFDSCIGITAKMINRKVHSLDESIDSIYAEIQRVDPEGLNLW